MTSPAIPIPFHAPAAVLPPSGPPTPAAGIPVARQPDPDDTQLTLDVDHGADTGVVRALGEIDILTVGRLAAALDDLLAAGTGTVVVDLREVSFIDCTGMGLLASSRRRARIQGTGLHIVAGRTVARTAAILDLTGALGLGAPG